MCALNGNDGKLILLWSYDSSRGLCFRNHLPPVSTLEVSSFSIVGSDPVVIKGWLENRLAQSIVLSADAILKINEVSVCAPNHRKAMTRRCERLAGVGHSGTAGTGKQGENFPACIFLLDIQYLALHGQTLSGLLTLSRLKS